MSRRYGLKRRHTSGDRRGYASGGYSSARRRGGRGYRATVERSSGHRRLRAYMARYGHAPRSEAGRHWVHTGCKCGAPGGRCVKRY